jgi:hypothetical protein
MKMDKTFLERLHTLPARDAGRRHGAGRRRAAGNAVSARMAAGADMATAQAAVNNSRAINVDLLFGYEDTDAQKELGFPARTRQKMQLVAVWSMLFFKCVLVE